MTAKGSEFPLLFVQGLSVEFPGNGSVLSGGRRFLALDGVTLALARGMGLGIVGESGAGKSTLALAVAGLIPATSGRVVFRGIELASLKGRTRRQVRRQLQMVFQEGGAILPPHFSIFQAVSEPLRIHISSLGSAGLKEQVASVLQDVGLSHLDQDARIARLSVGEAQRVAVARALVTDPEMVILDEPTSSLDASVQAQVLNLLMKKREAGLAFILVTHDPAVARQVCTHLAVLFRGQVVEIGPACSIICSPRHPYSQRLLAVAKESVFPPVNLYTERTAFADDNEPQSDRPGAVVPWPSPLSEALVEAGMVEVGTGHFVVKAT